MTLYQILPHIPSGDTVTIVDYIDGDIIINCEAVNNILESKDFHKFLKDYRVYKLHANKLNSNLVISVLSPLQCQ